MLVVGGRVVVLLHRGVPALVVLEGLLLVTLLVSAQVVIDLHLNDLQHSLNRVRNTVDY